ncbi:esterase/lipase family protein [Thaumasiovibrio sp. DFM-14]|uniref:esterase/lipase family protein n=1 Tax=Thaumasiovibrio sp. DFM-14 TaxID=3384792 RepID=UPI0039A09868
MRCYLFSQIMVIVSSLGLLIGCTHVAQPSQLVIASDETVRINIAGIKQCSSQSDSLTIDPNKPLTILVHGCFSSAGKFRSLAEVYKMHDQQVVCFEYDDRQSLDDVSGDLTMAINQLSELMTMQTINVIGHSQGGLIARRALIRDRADGLSVEHPAITLTTVSAPFNGVESAAHCGNRFMRVASIGMVDAICYAVTGEKYRQIPPTADFIVSPGELHPTVMSHLIIKTFERDSCRRYDQQTCVEDDFVFSLAEQTQSIVEAQVLAKVIVVDAGHVEIVGNEVAVPYKLIKLLSEQGLLPKQSILSPSKWSRLIWQVYMPQVTQNNHSVTESASSS